MADPQILTQADMVLVPHVVTDYPLALEYNHSNLEEVPPSKVFTVRLGASVRMRDSQVPKPLETEVAVIPQNTLLNIPAGHYLWINEHMIKQAAMTLPGELAILLVTLPEFPTEQPFTLVVECMEE